MTRDEAFNEMIKGYKVKHKYFSENEYIYMQEGVIRTETGISFIKRWIEDKNEEAFQDGWELLNKAEYKEIN